MQHTRISNSKEPLLSVGVNGKGLYLQVRRLDRSRGLRKKEETTANHSLAGMVRGGGGGQNNYPSLRLVPPPG